MAVESSGESHISSQGELLNPWFSMWMRPRETVRQMLHTGQSRHLALLAILGGIGVFLDQIVFASLGESYAGRLVMLVVFVIGGAIVGLVGLTVYCWLLAFAGRSLGGVGTAADCRTAYAWSNIPNVWLLPVYIVTALAVVIYGSEALLADLFRRLDAGEEFSMLLFPVWLRAVFAIGMMSRLWQLVLTCQSIAEAHRVSSGKGLFTFMIANVMFGGLVVAVAIPLQFLIFSGQ